MGVGGREARQGGGLRIIMAVLHCCVTETNTTLQKKNPFNLNFKKIEKNQQGKQCKFDFFFSLVTTIMLSN